ncbi:MAG: hypothetical protein OEM52_10945 [bacterium]|nr:hypothetical protein [bacterium]
MAIAPIPGSIDPRKLQEAAASARADAIDSSIAPSRRTSPSALRSDSASLAQEALAKQHELAVGIAALDALPAVRNDRVSEVEQRLTSGYYDNPEIFDAIAGKLTSDPIVTSAINDLAEFSAPAPTQAADSTMISNRLASKYYEQSQVTEVISERLVQDLTGRKV